MNGNGPMRMSLIVATLLSLPVADVSAQTPQPPRTRLTCDMQRGQRLSYIDNPMAAAGVNRKVTTADETVAGKIEIVYPAAGTDATMNVPASLRDVAKAGAAQLRRYPANEYTGFLGFDPDDGATWVVTYFARINKIIWTIHSPRVDGRDRAAQSRTLFGDCRRDELR